MRKFRAAALALLATLPFLWVKPVWVMQLKSKVLRLPAMDR
jgi:hypothetical protein